MQHGRLGETENNDSGWKQAEPCQLASKDLRPQFCHDGISSGVHPEEAGQPLPLTGPFCHLPLRFVMNPQETGTLGFFSCGGGLVVPLSSPQATKSRSPLSRNAAQSGWKSQAGKVGNWRQQGEDRKTEEKRERGRQQGVGRGGGLKV